MIGYMRYSHGYIIYKHTFTFTYILFNHHDTG